MCWSDGRVSYRTWNKQTTINERSFKEVEISMREGKVVAKGF